MGFASGALKRTADVILSAVALALSAPLWVWAMLAIGLFEGWPFLYSQTRVGRYGRVFRIYKFRSMVRDAEKHTGPVLSPKDDPRVTRVGRLMRKMAIDEIPQFVNILRGEMSWVGPRPVRPGELAEYLREAPNYGLRHTVRPGLTGVAQVYGSDYGNIPEKLALDLYYLEHRSLMLDLRLFVRSWANTLLAKWEKARPRRPEDLGLESTGPHANAS